MKNAWLNITEVSPETKQLQMEIIQLEKYLMSFEKFETGNSVYILGGTLEA
jgi:hypothetical protein